MPREQRPLERNCVEPDQEFIAKTSGICEFLTCIFRDSTMFATILTAQADGDKETLIDLLNQVRDFCEQRIKDLKEM